MDLSKPGRGIAPRHSTVTRRAGLAAAAGALAGPALAQSRAVTVVIPDIPGAPPDVVDRLLTDGLTHWTGTA